MFDKEEFQKLIVEAVFMAMGKFIPPQVVAPEKKYIHSIRGLANELHMSVVTCQKLKNSGRIPYKQEGRKVMFELNAVLDAMSVVNGRRAKS